MNTKYGQLPDESLQSYVNGMTAKIFKMLPMKQDGVKSLPLYIESILREFVGVKEVVFYLRTNEEFLTILGTVETLLNQNDVGVFRRDIFKILNLIERLKSSIGGDI